MATWYKFKAIRQFTDTTGHGWEPGLVFQGDQARYDLFKAPIEQALLDGHLVVDESGPVPGETGGSELLGSEPAGFAVSFTASEANAARRVAVKTP